MISPAAFFSRRWRWPTVAVLVGMVFLARLGFWQLDRLEWRRGLNAAKAAEMDRPPLVLNGDLTGQELAGMINRQAVASGAYDFEHQFIIESQSYNGRPGRFLVTPLRLTGREESILVNRGWLPLDETDYARFDRPVGPVEVAGRLAAGQTLSGGRQTEITADRRLFRVDVAAMAAMLPYPVLPVYLLPEAGDPAPAELPYPIAPDLSLSEGSHLSYAIQWFSFSLLLGVIYVYYVRRQSRTAAVHPPGEPG